jgi:Na+/melibiose symporter-like transporter
MNEPVLSDSGETSEASASLSSETVTHDDTVSSGFGSVLRNRSFLSIWLAQMASQTAQNGLWYALIIMVGHLTGQKPAGIGFTIILVQLPTVLFSSVSGVLVDRFSKRVILVGTNVIRVGGVLLYLLFQSHIAGLYLVTFLVAVVSQPFAPAEGSALPLLVKQEQLITANSLFQMTFMASQAVGFALAPIALGVFGVRTTLLVLAGLFAFSAIVLVPLPAVTDRRLPSEAVSTRELARGVWKDLTEVFRFIMGDPPLAIALFQIALAPTLLLVLAEVGPDYLTHGLHIGHASTSLFFLLAPAGAGLAIGMLILGQWGYRLKKDRLVLIALVSLGITVIGLASVPAIGGFWSSLGRAGLPIPTGVGLTFTMVPLAALMGIEVSFINAPVQTIVQQRATAAMRGRVLAMQQTLTAAMAIPPLILVGAVASIVGTPATLVMVGLVMVASGLAIVYYME